jgi:O-acetyl-ADP-ribose deacetylase
MSKMKLIKGDITKVRANAIVNAANTSLLGGGGVDGAIHRAGGSAILDDCRKIVARQGGCKVGEAVITTGGLLPAQYVIHTVGPVWNGGKKNETALLENCYARSLKLAVKNHIKSIAFPNISTGIYRFPKDLACAIAVKTVSDFLNENEEIDSVTFVCFDDENYALYDAELKNKED